MLRFAALTALLPAVLGQGVGTFQTETHPTLSWQQCSGGGSCQTRQGSVVIDSNWRWTHINNNFTNCYTGNTWDTTICPNGQTCAQNCVLDGANYQSTYGITAGGNSLTLKFVTQSQLKNVGSRVYLMASDTQYQMFRLLNQEFTFDVDVSQLPCGLNGALYFVTMDADGGMARYPTNRAGAKYGTGYCDAQCPRDLKWINGRGNVEGWTPSSNDPNAGTGNTGTCCAEMDVWEANSISSAFTPHPCTTPGQSACTGNNCSRPNSPIGICDQPGCDFNSYRMGVKNFYGPGMTVNTQQKMTVVTQFIGNPLTEIRRIWVQGGRVIQNSNTAIAGMATFNSITTNFCTAQKTAFSDRNDFQTKGGMSGMTSAMNLGMVLVMSIWDDHTANMLWLDSNYPLDRPADQPGTARGTCSTSSGVPADVESQFPNAQVVFSNIKFGALNSTYTAT